jgi:hypothetical protein
MVASLMSLGQHERGNHVVPGGLAGRQGDGSVMPAFAAVLA